MHTDSGNAYKRTSGATHAPLAYCPPLSQGQLLQDAGFWPFTLLPGVVAIAARTTLLAPCRSTGVYSNVEPRRMRAHTRVPCPSYGIPGRQPLPFPPTRPALPAGRRTDERLNLARHPEAEERAAGTAEWPRAWWHRGQRARKMRIAALVTALVGVGLAPQPAAAAGAAGCGSFYQDKTCREDCGSCSQPCCALEWEVGRCPGSARTPARSRTHAVARLRVPAPMLLIKVSTGSHGCHAMID
jgi:hypothetical protein